MCHRNPSQSLTVWTSDLHWASALDQPTVLASLGHEVIIAIGRNQSTPISDVWKKRGIHLYRRVSPTIKEKLANIAHHGRRITEKMIRDNFEFYKTDSTIASVDAFMCLIPSSMCEMWIPFNKTILFIPAHRYNMARCTAEENNRLNEHLNILASTEHPKHVIAASSKYDLEYLRHYTGLQVLPLYSFCGYYLCSNKRGNPGTAMYNNWDMDPGILLIHFQNLFNTVPSSFYRTQ